MALIAGAAALGGSIYGMTQGAPASNVQLPQQLPGVGSSANQFQDITAGLGQYNLYGQNIPQFSSISQGLVNNPYAAQFQQGAGPAGQLGQLAGLGQFGAGQNLYNAGNQILGASGAYNPQPLYNYLQNQNLQQANVENAMSGVAGTPYGAGVADTSNMQFNLAFPSWLQGQQLSALGGAGQAFGQGAALQGQAPQTYLQGAGIPYGTFNTIGQGQLGALGGLGQYGQLAAQIPQNQAQMYSQYALGGQGANNQLGQLGLNQAQLGFNQNATMGAGLGWGLGQLGNSFGGGGYSPYQMSAYNPSEMGPMLAGGLVLP